MKKAIVILILLFFPKIAYADDFKGYASYYSRVGCLGCSESLIMANGMPLDDTKLTVALPRRVVDKYGLMNKYVGIINLKTFDSVIVQVTDTGGFEKYNRVADLSVATKEALNCQSICKIYIVK